MAAGLEQHAHGLCRCDAVISDEEALGESDRCRADVDQSCADVYPSRKTNFAKKVHFEADDGGTRAIRERTHRVIVEDLHAARLEE
jgi:hypothetical protein